MKFYSNNKRPLLTWALATLVFILPYNTHGVNNPNKLKSEPSNSTTLKNKKNKSDQYVEGRVIVRFKNNIKQANKSAQSLHSKLGTKRIKRFDKLGNTELVSLAANQSVGEIIAAYRKNPNVLYAEPDYILKTALEPDDTRYSELWGMHNTAQTGGTDDADINAPEAWDLTTGSSNVIVAVIDTGVDHTHPDLIPNLWVNPGEIANNSIDDDGNGYIDDIYGINTINDSGDPMDDNGHGTHVSGTIGAKGNNTLGVVGVNWDIKIINCKFLSASGSGTTSDAIECLDYLLDLKTRASNPVDILLSSNSWGGGGYSQALYDAIVAHKQAGMLFIAAAGNSYSNNDSYPHYPSNFDANNIISVAATDHNDDKALFSNWGHSSVDIAAPGVDILSTAPTGSCSLCDPSGYISISGTSMATPHVSGLAALLKAQDTNRSIATINNLIMAGGQSIPAMADISVTGKRIRAADDNGVGALTCNNQILAERLSPRFNSMGILAGDSITLNYKHINCDQAAGNIDVIINPGNISVTLLDDGLGPDEATGDGIYSASISANVQTSITFPNNDVVNIDIIKEYLPAVQAPHRYRAFTGTALGLSDDSYAEISLPFPLPFAESSTSQTSLFVGSNGLISFGSGSRTYFNTPLPYNSHQMLVAPYWDDLNPWSGGDAYWGILGNEPNRELVIEWRDTPHFPYIGSVRFQIVFFENRSDVLVNYDDVNFDDTYYDNGASATIGIQVSRSIAEQFSYNTASISDAMSLLWQTEASIIADAGHHQAVLNNSTVNLDGTASFDPDGTIVGYQWIQISGNTVVLNDASTATPSFTVGNQIESFAFELTVTDNDGNTDTDVVQIEVIENFPPNADAGDDQETLYNYRVFLDGTASSDDSGYIESYSWIQTSGTAVTLDRADTAEPNFLAPEQNGALTFELTVTDNFGESATDVVTINIYDNFPPVAHAGYDQIVNYSDVVTLSGISSIDISGFIESYSWAQISGTLVELSGPDSMEASFTAPTTPDTLEFELTVTDDQGASDTDTVSITINTPPLANAGDDQIANEGILVTLDGTNSTDGNDEIYSYVWTQTFGDPVTLQTSFNQAIRYFTAPNNTGQLHFELTVTDTYGASHSDTIEININAAPSADAGSDMIVNLGDTVSLDGTGSSDPEDSNVDYSWLQLSGEPVSLDDSNSVTPSFTVPEGSTGNIMFRLQVSDSNNAVDYDTVEVTINAPPVAEAGADQIVFVGSQVNLFGADSYDTDGEIVSYSWTMADGSENPLNNANTETPGFLSTAAGTYIFELTVLDEHNASSTDTVEVLVQEKSAASPFGSVRSSSGGGGGHTGFVLLLLLCIGHTTKRFYKKL